MEVTGEASERINGGEVTARVLGGCRLDQGRESREHHENQIRSS
jgi:hypothetical protein